MEEPQKTRANIFTDEGRILQVEYAIKNVSNAGTTVGIICTDGILLFGLKKGTPSLYREKIYPISDEIYAAVSGSFGDSLRLISFARVRAHEIAEEYDIPCPIETLPKKVSELKQSVTQIGGKRPFGVAILYAGFSEISNSYVIYSTDPSGTIIPCKAIAFGENKEVIDNSLKNVFGDEMFSMQESTVKLIQIISNTTELTPRIADSVELLHFTTGKKRFLKKDEIIEIILKNDSEKKLEQEKKNKDEL